LLGVEDVIHHSLSEFRLELGFFSDLLSEDPVDKFSGEQREEKKRNKSDDNERDVNPVREGPEGIFDFFPFDRDVVDQRQKSEEKEIEKGELKIFDGIIKEVFLGSEERIDLVPILEEVAAVVFFILFE
jgi:hypothetical protein